MRKPYTEMDATSPISYYGKTKLLGEKSIISNCKKYYIIRISWLFGESTIGKNFVETVISLANKNKQIKVVNDQIGSPTYTGDVARVIDNIIKKSPEFGVYHFSGKGSISKYGQAREIIKYLKKDTDVLPCTSDLFPTPAKRPQYSYLSKNKIEKALDFKARSWQLMLKEYLKNR